jgi:hypothetical protein
MRFLVAIFWMALLAVAGCKGANNVGGQAAKPAVSYQERLREIEAHNEAVDQEIGDPIATRPIQPHAVP